MGKQFIISLIILFLAIKNSQTNLDKINKHFNIICGVDKKKSKAKIYNVTQSQNQLKSHERKLQDGEYRPIRIYLSNRVIFNILGVIPTLRPRFINLLEEAKNYIQKLINIIYLDYPIIIDEQTILDKNLAYEDFDTSMQYDHDLVSGINSDLVIIPMVDGLHDYISSENLLRDSATKRVIAAVINIPLNLIRNIEKRNFNHYIKTILLHLITHILGFDYESFEYFPGGLGSTVKTALDSRGINRTYIITPKVKQLIKKYYNCDEDLGLELENQDDISELNHTHSHWEARILLGEYMNSIIYKPEVVISEFTLALLEDSGWYKINYYTGGLMRFGKNKGCSFLTNDCCDNQGKTLFKNEFFDTEDVNKPSCSSGRLSRTYNKYTTYDASLIQYYRTLVNNNDFGGFTINSDYCFGFTTIDEEENDNDLYVGNCKFGSPGYGTQIIYNDNLNYKNGDIQDIIGEKYSNNSFCVLSESYPKGTTQNEINLYFKIFDTIVHPVCYEMYCTDYSLTIKIKDQYVVCPRKGGKVAINGSFKGYLYCPDYNLICTGTKLCNDLFDCIDKESLSRKANYDYDYNNQISSQKISQLKNEKVIFAYENNTEGICPENCGQCRDIKRCFKCAQGYKLLGQKEDDAEPIICDKNTNVSVGYFIKNETYYPCIEFCVQCNSSYTCTKCDNIHKTNTDRTECIDKVENCLTYDNIDFNCTKCKGDYVFIGDDREHCVIINEQDKKTKYYTLDEGISYYPCDTKIANCEICNNNRDLCTLCKTDYYFIKENRTFCFNDKNLSKYYTLDEGVSYYFCNDSISFCDTCDNPNTCQTCGQDHYFIKENRTHCVTGYDLRKYYTEDNKISYYPCSEVIDHCDECEARNLCTKCDNDYFFLGNDKSACRNDFDRRKYYTEDNITYYPCDTNFEFCDECTNKYTCTRCQYTYGFFGTDRSKCIHVGNEYYTDDGITFYPCYTNLLNCEQCLNKTHCIKCNQSFYFIEYDRTRCFNIYNLKEYYTEDGGISYFPCNTGIAHCKNCSSKYNCTACEATYYFVGNNRNLCVNDRNLLEYYTLDQGISYYPCHEAMDNCKNCIVPTTCMECQENTYFLRNDTSKCHSLNLKGYYTEDGKFYYPCSDSMLYCGECYNKHFCSKCNNDYFLKYEIHDQCFDRSVFENDRTYYKLNETHYKKCSSSIDNCLYCNNGTSCIQCEADYYFVNENYSKCVHISSLVPTDEYYKIDDRNYFACWYRKGVEFCKKCHNGTICLICEDRYAFINDIFNKCYPKSDLRIGYYHNDEDTIYYPCLPNCDYCVNGEYCQQCAPNNELIFDKTICGACQVDIKYITDDLNLGIIHSLKNKYFDENINNLTYVPHYINQNTNFSITIFRSWECTKLLFSKGYFYLNTELLSKKLVQTTGESLTSLTYIFVSYSNNRNYIEIYDSKNTLINLNQICPECLKLDFNIGSNLTNIMNSFGQNIANNIIVNDINIFNETDSYFSDFCSNFTIENVDIPLKERREMIFLGNQAKEVICHDITCEIENITINQLTGICQCLPNSDLSNLNQDAQNSEITFDNKGNNNFPIFTCFREGFGKAPIKSNAGFFIGLILIIIQILAFVIYVCTSKYIKKTKNIANPPLKYINSDLLFIEDFDNIIKENGMNRNNDKENEEMDLQDRDEVSEDLNSETYEDFENRKTLDHLLSEDGHRSQKDRVPGRKSAYNLEFDTYSVKIHSTKKERNEKLFFKDSEDNASEKGRNKNRSSYKNAGDIGSKSSFDSNDGLDEIRQIRKRLKTNKVYPSPSDAKKNNSTSFCQFYCFILGLRQPLINLLLCNECNALGDDFVPFQIKLIRFFFFISLNIFMNCLHLNHKYFYKKFEYFDNLYNIRDSFLEKTISSNEFFLYAFKNSALLALISFVICFLVQELLNRFVINNRKKIDRLLITRDPKTKINDEIIEILRNSKTKYIILFVINIIFTVAFYFLIINFFAVYRGGIIDYLAASTWTFIYLQIFPFILCFIFALFRYFGLKNSNNKLYKIGQLLIY